MTKEHFAISRDPGTVECDIQDNPFFKRLTLQQGILSAYSKLQRKSEDVM